MDNLKVFISKEGWGRVGVRVGCRNLDGSMVVIEPVQFRHFSKEHLESGVDPRPDSMMNLDEREAASLLQSFMDALWQEGYRPKDIGTAGHLSATQKHLEDMRSIAFSKLEVPVPCSA